MSTEELDPWKITSGLPLADTDVEILAFEFGFNAKIGAGLICANITFGIDEGEPVEQSFTVGDGWEITGKGAGIAGRKGLSGQSNWGRFVESCMVAAGPNFRELLVGVNPWEAATWIGTRWHLSTTEVTSTNPQTGVEKKYAKIIATEFLGTGETGSGKSAVKPVTAVKKAGGKPGLADTNPELFASLLELAAAHDDHDAFMAAALELPEVEADATAMNAVMSVKAGSVWAAK